MEYNVIKDASKIINKSAYLVKEPRNYKNKWSSYFQNQNPIDIELGTGRGDFIINMAKKFPKRNFVGIEIVDSQLVMAVERLKKQNLRLKERLMFR